MILLLLLVFIERSFLFDKRFELLKFVCNSEEDDREDRLLILEDGDIEEEEEEDEDDDNDIRRG
jgi:hypothetical protein